MADRELLDLMDKAANSLLEEAFGANPKAGELEPADEQKRLADKVKAFDAVRNWMTERVKLVPEDRGQGKGEQLRARFHNGRATSSRRTPKSATEEPVIDDSDGPPQSPGAALP